MDERRFDNLSRILGSAETRRRALKMLGGSGLAVLLARLSVGESGAACRKAKKSCRRDGQCCSGRCKKGRCKGNAKAVVNECVGAEPGTPTPCAGGNGCFCVTTITGEPFCGNAGDCSGCSADADCDAITGPGSACIPGKCGKNVCAAPCL
jgi:hypothetical protein